MNIHFQSPEYLSFLLGLLPLLGWAVWRFFQRRRQLARYASPEMQQLIMPLATGRKLLLRDLMILLAGALLLIVLARPQIAGRTAGASEDNKGIEAMICLDISNSMLCEDIAPNRLEFAKRTISKLLDEMKSDRVGLIVFAGSSFVQLPITTDLSTAQEFLGDISPNMISDQGTAIGAAIDLARQSFSDRKDLGKAIIVLTDGEDFEDNALEAAKAAKAAGIRINVVGVGTSEGGNIPTSGGPLTDETGNMVVTRFNPEMCQSLASAGEGVFVSSASQASVVKELKKQLDELPKGSVSGGSDSSAIEDYESWLWAAFVLLILEFCIMGRRNKFLIRYNIFGHEK